MNPSTQHCAISEQDYLQGELHSTIKHEVYDGQIYAMAGASDDHNRITANLSRHLGNHLEHSPCEVFVADMKIKIEQDFYYPDVMVVCADVSDNKYYRTSAVLIVEILSPATRKIDKVRKRRAYQSLPSLQEYVLIEQDIVEIEICRRSTQWQAEYYFLGDMVYCAALDLHLPVVDIYARVDNVQMQEWRAAASIGRYS